MLTAVVARMGTSVMELGAKDRYLVEQSWVDSAYAVSEKG